MKSILPLLLATLINAPLLAADVRVQVGDVEDRRTTGQFFSGAELELKLVGDVLDDATSVRAVIKSATDDTGRDLLPEKNEELRFEELHPFGRSSSSSPKMKLKLRNPSRKAVTIKEVRGELQFFAPRKDPQANVVVSNVLQKSGVIVDSPVLKAAKIEVMPMNKADFDGRKAHREDKNKGISGAIENAFAGFFGGFNMSENSLGLLVRDPDGKLVSIEFQDANGRKVRSNSSMSSGDRSQQTRVYDFEQKPPHSVVLQVLTEKAVITVPLELRDIPLP